jgi:hypothetical protein
MCEEPLLQVALCVEAYNGMLRRMPSLDWFQAPLQACQGARGSASGMIPPAPAANLEYLFGL